MNKIKKIFCDVDGTLTAGIQSIVPTSTGYVPASVKIFNGRDCESLELFREAGIQVTLATASNSARDEVQAWADHRKIPVAFLGSRQGKKDFFEDLLCGRTDDELREFALVGDSYVDLEIAKQHKGVHLFFPSDAASILTQEPFNPRFHQMQAIGGKGVLMDVFCEIKMSQEEDEETKKEEVVVNERRNQIPRSGQLRSLEGTGHECACGKREDEGCCGSREESAEEAPTPKPKAKRGRKPKRDLSSDQET